MRKFTFTLSLVLAVSLIFGQSLHQKTKNPAQSNVQVQKSETNNATALATEYAIDFEDTPDFSLTFDPWTVADVDGLNTYGFEEIAFPHSGEPMAYIAFNPDQTDPPLSDDPELQPHSGERFGACFASVPSGGQGNNDWLMTPMIEVGDGSSINLWAKSYTDQYGLERFNVAVSTTTNDPAEFQVISGPDYIEAPVEWTEYNFDLSEYAGMEIYVAIQCVSNDAFVFMVDDIVVDPGTVASDCQTFEQYADFTLDFTPWMTIDVDGLETYGFEETTFPNNYEPMAFIVFDPAQTDPPMTDDDEIQPYEGEQFAACFSSIPSGGQGNNDWLISPLTTLGSESMLSFYAKSYTDQYGLERFNVGVSTTGTDPGDFTLLNEGGYMEAPMAWTNFEFDLSEYNNQEVYVAIQCVSEDAFVFMVDNVCIMTNPTAIEDVSAATFNVYPNPATEMVTVSSNEKIEEISVLNSIGQMTYLSRPGSEEVQFNTSEFETGIYFVRMKTASGIETVKLMVE